MTEKPDPKMTLPPAAKVAKVKAEGKTKNIALLVGAVTDIVGILWIGAFVMQDKLDGVYGAGLIIALATGTIVGKLRGKPGGSTMALVGAFAATAAKGAGAAPIL